MGIVLMANEQNLTSKGFAENTTEKQREIAAAGGRASGVAKREKKTLRQLAEILGERPISVANPDGSKEEVTYKMAMLQAQYRKAITEGDTTAAKFIAELLGEMKQRIDFEGGGLAIVVKDKAEADRLAELKDMDV